MSTPQAASPAPTGQIEPDSLTIVIPAHDEAAHIGACLSALLAQDEAAGKMAVIVSANACKDDTVRIAQGYREAFQARGSCLKVLDRETPGKLSALNAADDNREKGTRLYLDADIVCAPALIGQIRAALSTPEPRYATGTLAVAPAKSPITRAYARLWQELPFVKDGAVGAGLYAVNTAGRARWKDFPDIISDDTFVRLHFAPQERIEVSALYHWPMIEGFSALVKVRRRQDAGVAQLRARYPDLFVNDTVAPIGLAGMLGLALRMPLAFAVYVCVALAVRSRRSDMQWVRGR